VDGNEERAVAADPVVSNMLRKSIFKNLFKFHSLNYHLERFLHKNYFYMFLFYILCSLYKDHFRYLPLASEKYEMKVRDGYIRITERESLSLPMLGGSLKPLTLTVRKDIENLLELL